MIKNIVFDLGNVLLSFKPLEYLRTKVTDERKIEQLHKEIFSSEEWLMLDRGIITEEEAINRLCDRNPHNSELIKLSMDNWYEILTPIEETVEILKEVKAKGYRTFVLSNFHLLAYEDVIKRCGFFKFFVGGIISYKENLLKPESEIYEKLILKYDIDPTETIFIDDTKVNVEGAQKLGIETILFTNPEELREKLIEYKVLDER